MRRTLVQKIVEKNKGALVFSGFASLAAAGLFAANKALTATGVSGKNPGDDSHASMKKDQVTPG